MKYRKRYKALMKTKESMKSPKSPQKCQRLTAREWLLLAGFLMLYFFYMKSSEIILNSPNWLLGIVFISAITIVTIINCRELKARVIQIQQQDKFLSIGLILLKYLVVSYFIAGIFLIPFNYYIIYKSKNSISTYEKCEILGISTNSKNKKIFYRFKGKTNVLYAYTPIMEEIKNNRKFNDYVFTAEFKNGLLGTYILENWSIEKK